MKLKIENKYNHGGVKKNMNEKEILDLIDKRIENYKELNKKFPKNITFLNMWTALFELQYTIRSEEENE